MRPPAPACSLESAAIPCDRGRGRFPQREYVRNAGAHADPGVVAVRTKLGWDLAATRTTRSGGSGSRLSAHAPCARRDVVDRPGRTDAQLRASLVPRAHNSAADRVQISRAGDALCLPGRVRTPADGARSSPRPTGAAGVGSVQSGAARGGGGIKPRNRRAPQLRNPFRGTLRSSARTRQRLWPMGLHHGREQLCTSAATVSAMPVPKTTRSTQRLRRSGLRRLRGFEACSVASATVAGVRSRSPWS